MALKIPPAIGKLLYGALFVLVLPAALAAWARGADANVTLPSFQNAPWGAAIAGAGFLLWLAGVSALRVKGGGLPMNAFPPPRLVVGGIYAATSQPVYAGFTLMAAGAAVVSGSAAAQWLVVPILALCAAALWWGYERIDLRARLGAPPRAAWFDVPFNSADAPRFTERLGSLALTLATPALGALMLDGSGLAGRAQHLPDDTGARFWAALALAGAGALAAGTCSALRNLVLTSWVGSLLLALAVLILPSGPFGGRLPLSPAGALLSLTAMAGIAALAGRLTRISRTAGAGVAVSLGLFLIGRGGLPSAESSAGALAFILAVGRWRCWQAALQLCERTANCWRETDFGRVRILHIGWLAALPAFGAAAFAVLLAGPSAAVMTVLVFAFVIVGSALWAQLIEGSPALSRPYGFFGGVVGVALFALVVAPGVFDTSPWLVMAVFATVAPWAQAFARFRCLANGCCHGAPCDGSWGVVYRNPRSRVVRLAHLGGVPIHPTQLYSFVGNVLAGALTMRLWAEGAGLSLIVGVYFAAMGLARFVEEAWRGEPQTPIHAGLRLYQWLSIACVVAGAGLTAIPDTPPAPAPAPGVAALWAGLAAGALTWLVASVDFPRSHRRFARLA